MVGEGRGRGVEGNHIWTLGEKGEEEIILSI
jgi:hypothetical protein